MKKYLISLLTTMVIIPTVTTQVASFNNRKNSETNTTLYQSLNPNKSSYHDMESHWNDISSLVTKELNDKSLFGDMPDDEKTAIANNAKTQITKFQTNEFTNQQALNDLEDQNATFKNNYTNPEAGLTDLAAKIDAHFFGNHKLDLTLDGANNYQDALTQLNKQLGTYIDANGIHDTYQVTLTDPTQAQKTLFDDSSVQTINAFINDTVTFQVNFQLNSGAQATKTVQLSNIQLQKTTSQETHWLYEAVSDYFSATNAQNLDLKLTDTRQAAFDKVLQKIKAHFANYDNNFKLTLSNPGLAQEQLDNNDLANYIINDNAWFGVTINPINDSNSQDTKQSLEFHFNFALDFTQTSALINQLFLTTTTADKNLDNIDLHLNSGQTYQDVIDRFNARLQMLDSIDGFSVQLTDPTQAKTAIDVDHVPTDPFTVSLTFGFQLDNQFVPLGSNKVILANVTLTPDDKIRLDSYNKITEVLKTLQPIDTALSDISLAAAILSFSATLASAVFPPAATVAFWSGVIAAATGLIDSSINLAQSALNDEIDTFTSAFSNISTAVGITTAIFSLIMAAVTKANPEVEVAWKFVNLFFDAQSFIKTALGIANDAYGWFNNL